MEKKLCFGLGIIVLLSVGACAGPSRVEMDFGTSAKLAVFNQTVNPQAGKDQQPVVGLDGGAAKGTMEKYRKDFEKPAPPATNVYTIQTGITGK